MLIASDISNELYEGSNHLALTLYEDERDRYFYIRAKARQAAKEYYEYMTDETYGVLPVRASIENSESAAQLSEFSPIGATAFSLVTAIARPAGLLYSLSQSLQGKEINPYHSALTPETVTSAMRNNTKKMITEHYGEDTVGAFLGNLGYDVLTSAADSAINAALMGGITAPIGKAAEAAKNSTRTVWAKGNHQFDRFNTTGLVGPSSAIQGATFKGATPQQALYMGGATFIAETFTESITFGNIKEAFKMGTAAQTKGFVKQLLLNGMEESAGEMVAEAVGKISDDLIMGKLSEREANITQYTKEGMSQAEAEERASRESFKDILYSGLVGFVSSGASTAAGYGAGMTNVAESTASEQAVLEQVQQAVDQQAPIQVTEQVTEQSVEQAESAELTEQSPVEQTTEESPSIEQLTQRAEDLKQQIDIAYEQDNLEEAETLDTERDAVLTQIETQTVEQTQSEVITEQSKLRQSQW